MVIHLVMQMMLKRRILIHLVMQMMMKRRILIHLVMENTLHIVPLANFPACHIVSSAKIEELYAALLYMVPYGTIWSY